MPQNQHTSLTAEESLAPRWEAIVGWVKETGASCAFLLLGDPNSSALRNAACYGRQELPQGYAAVARWVLSRAEPLCLEREADAEGIMGGSLSRELLPVMCVPILSNAAPRGVLIVASPPSATGFLRWLPFLESLAELAGAILEKAALQKNLHHKDEQVQDLIRGTLDAQEAERERVCLEVHDGVTQTLASAFQYLQTLEAALPASVSTRQLLLRAIALVKQAIQESREVINSLQPASLRDLGLVSTLRQEVRQLEQELGWEIDFKADDSRLPWDVETGLYRIIKEAIANARKHAHTRRLRVRIAFEGDRVKVEVKDWGTGFNYNPQGIAIKRGTGLFSMRKRAELLQGSCDIQSTPGQGTAVYVEIPLLFQRNSIHQRLEG